MGESYSAKVHSLAAGKAFTRKTQIPPLVGRMFTYSLVCALWSLPILNVNVCEVILSHFALFDYFCPIFQFEEALFSYQFRQERNFRNWMQQQQQQIHYCFIVEFLCWLVNLFVWEKYLHHLYVGMYATRIIRGPRPDRPPTCALSSPSNPLPLTPSVLLCLPKPWLFLI